MRRAAAAPCSAELGVVLGMLGAISFGALLSWTLCVVGVLLAAGWLAARLIPGRPIPPSWITLFVPCIASVLMIVKEQSVRIAAAMLARVMPSVFLVGGVVRWIGQVLT